MQIGMLILVVKTRWPGRAAYASGRKILLSVVILGLDPTACTHLRRGACQTPGRESRSKGSKQVSQTLPRRTRRTTEDHGAVSILGASRGRAIEHRAKRHHSLLRGPPWSSRVLRVENLLVLLVDRE